MEASANTYDVAVIGGGPTGCVAALAFAKKGKRVLVCEANPRSKERLAGEWLHPPALEIMEELGISVAPEQGYLSGRGFAVFPDDGSKPVVLPYQAPRMGLAIEHHRLVDLLRAAVRRNPFIEYFDETKATRILGQTLTLEPRGGAPRTVTADLIVGAAGRASVAHQALGLEKNTTSYSRMAGLLLFDVDMPFEGYGHVFLGGPGPALAYRIAHDRIRVCLDVPLTTTVNRDRAATLWDGFAPVFPKALRQSFRRALESGEIQWAANQIRPRGEYGREGLVLVGDAAGHSHPLTAAGMTIGFADAVELADAKSFKQFRRQRLLRSRVPEMLAIALYEVFADSSDETISMREAIYEMWRNNPAERTRTMGFLAGLDTSPAAFGRSFVSALGIGTRNLVRHGLNTRDPEHFKEVSRELGARLLWLMKGTLHITPAEPTRAAPPAEERYGAALKAAVSRAEVVEHPSFLQHVARRSPEALDPAVALARGAQALVAHQAEDGSWEGEVVWCAMLPAQYVMACHVMGLPLDETRRRRILTQFEKTQLPDGTWGLSERSDPYLFVTTLVYVAARLLGVSAQDPLLTRAAAFIEAEGGVERIPTWGKFWLAMLNLYGWEGVNPVLPEVWRLPKWSPLHPSRYYCHTRQIYLGMASVYAQRVQAPSTAVIQALRAELYPRGYEQVDFAKLKDQLREEEIFTPPSGALKLMYKSLSLLEKLPRSKTGRAELLEELRNHIRYELRATHYTSISPVSGLLNIITLWLADPEDEDLKQALQHFEGWIWEDDVDGLRIAGARSASWDSAFALQALAAAAPHVGQQASLQKGDEFLVSQQIEKGIGAEAHYYRLDPAGGYCFAGVWHGWPVSDCTAEAILARMENPAVHADPAALARGVKFILQCQNSDGGFGSYEARRVDVPLEWMNPAEMFGDSMTEHSYVECTASCVAALARFRQHCPDVMAHEVDAAVRGGVARIRALQRTDGSWEGNWGVNYIYGTMFGLRGLIAGGVPPQDPAVRRGCQWLLSKQRADGGWGEKKSLTYRGYLPADEAQATQTAWALSGLLEAQEPDFAALERGARSLAAQQLDNGEWPKQEPVGIFFHTALLDYVLYKQYFPVWTLGLYESRRQARGVLLEASRAAAAS
ncbi:MAG: FAD-dependent monooxygenase [Myxococcales bacterium]|nr:FAD-dependent monooxygenase [Myxococcales bacterium]